MELTRDLVAASSVPLVLSLLKNGPGYGYAIIRAIRELSGGQVEWTEGMLYPVLHRLEEQKLVESYWDNGVAGRRRKYYRITEQGLNHLQFQLNQWRMVDGLLRGGGL